MGWWPGKGARLLRLKLFRWRARDKQKLTWQGLAQHRDQDERAVETLPAVACSD